MASRTTTDGEKVPGRSTESVDKTTAYLDVESTTKGVPHGEIVADHAQSQ